MESNMRTQDSTDIAIQILLYLESQSSAAQLGAKIAQAIDITYPRFIRIATRMHSKGLLSRIPGAEGGYMLACPASEISFYDVFRAVEGEPFINQHVKNHLHSAKSTEREHTQVYAFLQSVQEKLVAEMASKPITELVS